MVTYTKKDENMYVTVYNIEAAEMKARIPLFQHTYLASDNTNMPMCTWPLYHRGYQQVFNPRCMRMSEGYSTWSGLSSYYGTMNIDY